MSIPPAQPSSIARGAYCLASCLVNFATEAKKPSVIAGVTLGFLSFHLGRKAKNLYSQQVTYGTADLQLFDALPSEVQQEICSYLPGNDMLLLKAVNRAARGSGGFWNQAYANCKAQGRRRYYEQLRGNCYNAFLSVRNANKRKVFEATLILYSISHAHLTFLGQAPEFAPTVYKIQRVLLFIDVPLSIAAGFLSVPSGVSIKSRGGFTFFLPLGGAALGAASALGLHRFFKPSLDPATLLSKVPFPLPRYIALSWVHDGLQFVLQIAFFLRALSSAFLTFNPHNQTQLPLISTLFSLCSLASISRLRFLAVTVAMNLTSEKNSRSFLPGLTGIFLISPNCSNNEEHLLAAVKPLFEYVNQLFHQCLWHWNFQYTNATPTGGQLAGITITHVSPLQSCACTATATLVHLVLCTWQGRTMSSLLPIHFSPPSLSPIPGL